MKIIFAQGNPESQFDNTRHNIGFLVLDQTAKRLSIDWTDKPKFKSLIAETNIDNEKVLFVKPTTFYNETGQSARSLVDFYKLNPSTEFLVVHDDLALPFGTIRTRQQGSDAGNNGIKSINAHIGPDYARIRIGIHNDLRDRIDDADFVLGHFSAEENKQLKAITQKATDLIDDYIAGNLETTTHK